MRKIKKSQMQMGETIAVLFVFFIFVAIGFIFYGRILRDNLESDKEELTQLRSIGIAQKVMFLPEIQCSEDNIIIDNCADKIKLELLGAEDGLMKKNDNQLHYYDLFEFSDVTVKEIYPESDEWLIYSRKITYKNKFSTNVPISIYDPVSKTYGFGILSIESYFR